MKVGDRVEVREKNRLYSGRRGLITDLWDESSKANIALDGEEDKRYFFSIFELQVVAETTRKPPYGKSPVQSAVEDMDKLKDFEAAVQQGWEDAGRKDDSDKPRMDLLDGYALNELAKVLTFGAKKYAVNNWRKGIVVSRLLAALLRHAFAICAGEDKDPETGLDHAAHAMCCCMFLIWTMKCRPDMDDRWKAHNFKGGIGKQASLWRTKKSGEDYDPYKV